MAKDESRSQSAWLRAALEQYEKPLTQYAARITRDAESARDVVQETFMRLCWEKPAKLDGHLSQWLYTVCRNRALDVKRKENRMQDLTEVPIAGCAEVERDPSRIAENREGVHSVLQSLEALPDSQQEVVRLRFQAGLSYREIAHVTNLSVSNVGFLLHTAIKTIREKLSTEAISLRQDPRSQS